MGEGRLRCRMKWREPHLGWNSPERSSATCPQGNAGARGACRLAEDEREDALLRERTLLYVAATRARGALVVTWVGVAPGLLR